MQAFYLVSTERREPYTPWKCRLIKRLHSEIRDDLALVELDPPMPRHIYDTDEDLQWLILASRFQGDTLYAVTTWPLYVYICTLKERNHFPDLDSITSNDLIILDWGKISNSPKRDDLV